MAENELTGATASEGVNTSQADNIPVQTAASEQETREARLAAAIAERGGNEADAGNDAGAASETASETENASPEPMEQPARKAVPKLEPWAQKKLDEMAFAQREATRKARQLEQELERLRAASGQAQTPVAANAADNQAAIEKAPVGGYASQEEFDRAVRAEADRRLAEESRRAAEARFNEECNATYAKGVEEFSDFPDAIKTLQNAGAMTPGMIEAALATDAPHKVLYELGTDPERAQKIMSMPLPKMVAELTKLALAQPAQAAARPVSKAPAPVRPVEGSARVSHDPRDDDDDKTWFAKREAQRRERLGLR